MKPNLRKPFPALVGLVVVTLVMPSLQLLAYPERTTHIACNQTKYASPNNATRAFCAGLMICRLNAGPPRHWTFQALRAGTITFACPAGPTTHKASISTDGSAAMAGMQSIWSANGGQFVDFHHGRWNCYRQFTTITYNNHNPAKCNSGG